MASITEILTLLVIIIGILILPKMFRKEEKGTSHKRLLTKAISVPARLGIIISILLPLISALVLQPWKQNLILFILAGIVPLIIGWGLYWMFAGLKNKKRAGSKKSL
ncbi:MAG: hypothetical protein K8R67_08825 [Desulfobacteraceae bacterium]|nr:hypothetical protein [Desulfobacteraceae bacterium]